MALVLLIGAGLLMRSFVALKSVDPGYDTRDVFTFQFAPEQPALVDGPSWARFHLDFLERLQRCPASPRSGIVENVPLDEGTRDDRFRTEEMPEGPDVGPTLDFTFAAGDYFRTMSIAVLDGRPFETADHVSELGHVVVSRSAANLLWPGQRAIGRRLQQRGSKDWHTVIGVVKDVMQYGYRDTPQALVYFPLVGPTPEGVGPGVAGLRDQDRARRDDRPGGARPDPRGRPRGPDVPLVHDGRPGRALDDPALLRAADPRHRLGPRPLPRRGRPLRRPVLRGRGAHPRDRRTNGPRRDRRRASEGWSSRRAPASSPSEW